VVLCPTLCISGSGDASIKVTLSSHASHLSSLTLLPFSGNRFGIGDQDSVCKLFKTTRAQSWLCRSLSHCLPFPHFFPLLQLSLQYDEGGNRLISGSYDKTVKVPSPLPFSSSSCSSLLTILWLLDLGYESILLFSQLLSFWSWS
jgi:hypothetical protein